MRQAISHFFLALLALLALLASACSATEAPSSLEPDAGQSSPYPPEILDWVHQSGWIIDARVDRLHDATEPAPPDELDPDHLWNLDRMLVARTLGAAKEPTEAPVLPGMDNTFILNETPSLAPGDVAYFFVTLFEAGESFVFLEIATMPITVPLEQLSSDVEAIDHYFVEKALYDRMVGASKVVVGTVTATEELPGPVTDELPDWWQGQVAVEETIRGSSSSGDLTVRFDASEFYRWYQRPKLQVGEHAIFFLYPDDQSGAEGAALLVLDPLDVEKLDDEPHLRALLDSPPVPPPL